MAAGPGPRRRPRHLTLAGRPTRPARHAHRRSGAWSETLMTDGDAQQTTTVRSGAKPALRRTLAVTHPQAGRAAAPRNPGQEPVPERREPRRPGRSCGHGGVEAWEYASSPHHWNADLVRRVGEAVSPETRRDAEGPKITSAIQSRSLGHPRTHRSERRGAGADPGWKQPLETSPDGHGCPDGGMARGDGRQAGCPHCRGRGGPGRHGERLERGGASLHCTTSAWSAVEQFETSSTLPECRAFSR
jgi:hypothetical protein